MILQTGIKPFSASIQKRCHVWSIHISSTGRTPQSSCGFTVMLRHTWAKHELNKCMPVLWEISTSDLMQITGKPPSHLVSKRLPGQLDTQHSELLAGPRLRTKGGNSLVENTNRPLTVNTLKSHKCVQMNWLNESMKYQYSVRTLSLFFFVN